GQSGRRQRAQADELDVGIALYDFMEHFRHAFGRDQLASSCGELPVERGKLEPSLFQPLPLRARVVARSRLGVRLHLPLHGANFVLLLVNSLRVDLLSPRNGVEERAVGDRDDHDCDREKYEHALAQAHRVEAIGVALQRRREAHGYGFAFSAKAFPCSGNPCELTVNSTIARLGAFPAVLRVMARPSSGRPRSTDSCLSRPMKTGTRSACSARPLMVSCPPPSAICMLVSQ